MGFVFITFACVALIMSIYSKAYNLVSVSIFLLCLCLFMLMVKTDLFLPLIFLFMDRSAALHALN